MFKHFYLYICVFQTFDLAALNETAKAPVYPTNKKLKDLIIGESYQIVKLKCVNTKFGEKIVAHYIDKDDTINTSFLPARVSIYLIDSSDTLSKMKKVVKSKKLFFKYLGGRYNEIQFIQM